ncbi:GNAT family N-acetyltransferase [Simplicispira psychrophila]|uniref:GNAT family N-acetyltransferase n=1 Tax=Simplicispira psychrophila TaxID=80882 RepID=UPI000A4CC8CA|nr:GNAT family N-acetyltransferase [Simplicispira psychrophila]
MSADVFQTEAWFAYLLAHGFEQPPLRQGVWQLSGAAQGEALCLPVMQHTPRGAVLALGNYYSGLYGPVGAVDRLERLSAVQWQAAVENLRSRFDSAVLRLQPLDAESAWLAALEKGLRSAGWWIDRFFCFGNWYQPVPKGGFGVYWAQRPSALQHSVARGRRRLGKAGTWRIDLHTDTSAATGLELEQAIAAYQSVYARSWKAPEPCAGFMPGLMRLAVREGWLRLGVLWLNDQPVAAQLWLVYGGKANIYKLAYVQGQEKLSVGSVLTAALMEHAMEVDHVREVDYLSGDDAYKADWMAHRRARVGLVAFDPRRLRGWLAAGRHFAGRIKK